MYVKVNTDSLNKQATKIDSYIQDSLNDLKQAKEVLGNIPNAWQGSDQKQFNDKTSNFIQNLSKMTNSLQTYNNFIKGYVNAVETLDKYYKNKKIAIK